MNERSEIELKSRAEAMAEADLFVEVPPTIRDRRELIQFLAERLSFPEPPSFPPAESSLERGHRDWPMLAAGLEDLSWLRGVGTVVLFHGHVPMADEAGDLVVYLAVLETAMGWRNESGSPILVAAFDPTLKSELSNRVVSRFGPRGKS